MKNVTFILVILSVFVLSISCKNKNSISKNSMQNNSSLEIVQEDEEYRIADQHEIDQLNNIIKEKKLNSETLIMKEYAPEILDAGENYLYMLSRKTNANSNTITLSLLEDDIPDDSMKARKVIMTIIKEDNIIKVIDIKETYQCWRGRGHQEWGTTLCN